MIGAAVDRAWVWALCIYQMIISWHLADTKIHTHTVPGSFVGTGQIIYGIVSFISVNFVSFG